MAEPVPPRMPTVSPAAMCSSTPESAFSAASARYLNCLLYTSWDIGWEDYLARGAVCAVEWSENVEGAFYGDEIRVVFEKTGENSRRIRIEGD